MKLGEKLQNRRELALALKKHPQSVTKWAAAGMPVAEPGRKGKPSLYSLTKVRAWLKAREETAKKAGPLDPLQERAQKDKMQAALVEQTLRVRAGKLLPADEVERVWAKEITGVKSIVLAWPQTSTAKVHRAAIQDGEAGVERALHDLGRDLLRELADPERKVKQLRERRRSKKAPAKKGKSPRRSKKT